MTKYLMVLSLPKKVYVEKPKNYLKIGCHLKGHSFYEDEVVLFSYDDLK